MRFLYGDVVKLKNQTYSPHMTITDRTGDGLIICSWFNIDQEYDQIIVHKDSIHAVPRSVE